MSDYLQSRLYCAFKEHAAHEEEFTVFCTGKQLFGVSLAAGVIRINNRPAVDVGVLRFAGEEFGFNVANQRGGDAV